MMALTSTGRLPRYGVTCGLLLALLVPGALRAQGTDPALARGIAQVVAGSDDAATRTLQGVVRRLYDDGSARADLARAYLYLGIAWARLDDRELAVGNFGEALAIDWDLKLDPGLTDARVRDAFEAARKETQKAGRAPESAAKKGAKGLLIAGGVAAGAVGAAALKASGKSEPVPHYRIQVNILEQVGGGGCEPLDGQATGGVVFIPPYDDYAKGSRVRLEARPTRAPFLFVAWGGACASFGSAPQCTVQVEGETLVTACFEAEG